MFHCFYNYTNLTYIFSNVSQDPELIFFFFFLEGAFKAKTRGEAEQESSFNDHQLPIPTLPGRILQVRYPSISESMQVSVVDQCSNVPTCSGIPVPRLFGSASCTLALGLELWFHFVHGDSNKKVANRLEKCSLTGACPVAGLGTLSPCEQAPENILNDDKSPGEKAQLFLWSHLRPLPSHCIPTWTIKAEISQASPRPDQTETTTLLRSTQISDLQVYKLNRCVCEARYCDFQMAIANWGRQDAKLEFPT